MKTTWKIAGGLLTVAFLAAAASAYWNVNPNRGWKNADLGGGMMWLDNLGNISDRPHGQGMMRQNPGNDSNWSNGLGLMKRFGNESNWPRGMGPMRNAFENESERPKGNSTWPHIACEAYLALQTALENGDYGTWLNVTQTYGLKNRNMSEQQFEAHSTMHNALESGDYGAWAAAREDLGLPALPEDVYDKMRERHEQMDAYLNESNGTCPNLIGPVKAVAGGFRQGFKNGFKDGFMSGFNMGRGNCQRRQTAEDAQNA
ncbi:Uncharacterised protein [uncultured archaeon]|nr:Uncharacterised protein [uncultured archaeon]